MATSYVNVSTDTVGVDSDTVQAGELLNYDFYTANPVVGATSPPQQSGAVVNTSTTKAFVDAVDITLNQINLGHEDIAVLLKLYDGVNYTTQAAAGQFHESDYQPITGSTDVLVSVTADDYPAGYMIYGIQVLTSTENIHGYGLRPDRPARQWPGSDRQRPGGQLGQRRDEDHQDRGAADQPGDADLQFTGNLVDADGDEASGLNFNVHLEGDSEVLRGAAATT